MAAIDYRTTAQNAYFRAARELRAVAARVLDDMQNDVELTSELSTAWAKDKARDYAEQANALEETGYQFSTPSTTAERTIRRSREAYSESITAYEARKASAEQRAQTPA